MNLNEEELKRYNRNILLKEIGLSGQKKLKEGRVLVIGAGGLGSPNCYYLAAVGVGTIGIADDDVVDVTNLQRQVIHFTENIGERKANSAAHKIKKLNPDVKVHLYNRICNENIISIIREYDFVIDATDNFHSKFLINDACVLSGLPFSHGGVVRFMGHCMTILPGKSGCYRCMFKAPPAEGTVASSSEAGIMGTVAGVIGTLQATEAVKYLTGAGELCTNALLTYDALATKFRKVHFEKNIQCPVCGENPTITNI